MLTGVENCWRMPPADSAVAAWAKVVSFSTSTMRPPKPAVAR
jgi:hypothetical protein